MKPYPHFTPEERECLYFSLKKGRKISEIAIELGRSKSTISREIRRKQNYKNEYNPIGAMRKYRSRRKNSCRKSRLNQDKELYEYVLEYLKVYWSPEMIDFMWNVEHSNNSISHSTICLAIEKEVISINYPSNTLKTKG